MEVWFQIFLCIQLIPIIHYYWYFVSDYHNNNQWSFESLDERFTWRMFSPLSRITRCKVEFTDTSSSSASTTTTLIELKLIYQKAWRELCDLCRRSVIESISADLCRRQVNSSISRLVSIRLLPNAFTWTQFPTNQILDFAENSCDER
jgi:hypothetical protein